MDKIDRTTVQAQVAGLANSLFAARGAVHEAKAATWYAEQKLVDFLVEAGLREMLKPNYGMLGRYLRVGFK
jgi:3-methyladenine DNA glycosylase AlkC